MSAQNDLPFERGATAYGGDATLISNADASAYTGITAVVVDESTGEKIKLIAMRNSSGGVIYPGFGYKPAAGYIGRRVDTYPSAGGFGYVLDYHYREKGVNSVANGDVAWFIHPTEGGRATGKTGANWADGNALAFAANGVMSPCSSTTAGTYVIARANEAKTHTSTATSGEFAVCYVGQAHGFFASDAVSQSGL